MDGLASLTGLLARVPVDVGRDQGRTAAVHELLHPIYHRDDPTLYDRLRNWFLQQLGRLVVRAAERTPGDGWGLLLIVSVIAALVALALWRRGAPARSRPSDERALFHDDDRSAAELRAAADRAAAAGLWDLALQERFRAVIRGLEERTIVDRRPGWTAAEASSAAARQLPTLAGELAAAALAFDGVTYGARHADAAAETRVRELDRAARATTPRRSALASATLTVPS
jgi:Domain of unknown function (DUF4129)